MTAGLKPYPAYKDSGVEWIGQVPTHWAVARLRHVLRNVVVMASARSADGLCLALENVESWSGRTIGGDSETVLDSRVKQFRKNDILFGKLRPYLAKVVRPAQDGVCVGEFLVLRPLNSAVSSAYFEHLLRSKPVIDFVNCLSYGAKMPRVEWQSVGATAVPFPPLPEQTSIVRFLEDKSADTADAIAHAQREIDLLGEYRARLISDVVTGKLDVREAAANLPEEVEEPEEPREGQLVGDESEVALAEDDEVTLEEVET